MSSSLVLLVFIDHELCHQGHPEDILPLLLTSVTQEMFSCIAEEHVTGESPYKLLKKDDVVQDMKRRAAVSDFSPAKQTVLVSRLIVTLIPQDATHDDTARGNPAPPNIQQQHIWRGQKPEEHTKLKVSVSFSVN